MLFALAATLGGPRLLIADKTALDTQFSPTNASATVTIKSDGTYSKTEGGSETSFGDWLSPTSAAALFEYKATELSGTLTSGTVGSYVTGTQAWTVARTTVGTSIVSLQVEVRMVGSTTVLSTVTFTIEATKEP